MSKSAIKVTTADLILKIYRTVSGEWDPTITPDSEDGQTVLAVINDQVDIYYNSIDRYGRRVIWQRNIDPEYVIGTADGSSTQFEIDWDEVQALPDGFYMPVMIGEQRYDIVPYEQLMDSRNSTENRCSISAEGLVFLKAPDGGDIKFPCVPYGQHLTGEETDVETVTGVHNLTWLQWASAAEYVRTDIVRGSQYPNVLAQANDTFNRMLSDNKARSAPLLYAWETTTPPQEW